MKISNKKSILLLYLKHPTIVENAMAIARMLHDIGCDVCSCPHAQDTPIENIKHAISNVSYHAVIGFNMSRYDYGKLFNNDIHFITFMQDNCSNLENETFLNSFNNNENDFAMGYTSSYIDSLNNKRLLESPIFIDYDNYSDMNIKRDNRAVFIADKGHDVSFFISNIIVPVLKKYNIDIKETITSIRYLVDIIYQIYDNGGWINRREDFSALIRTEPTFKKMYQKEKTVFNDVVSILMYWYINDVIFRHTCIRWCIKEGIRPLLLGGGWFKNKKFNRYSISTNAIYDAALKKYLYSSHKYVLHFNVLDCLHNRPVEALLCGSTIITRSKRINLKPDIFDREAFIYYQKLHIANMLEMVFNHGNGVKEDIHQCNDFFNYSYCFDNKSQLKQIWSSLNA